MRNGEDTLRLGTKAGEKDITRIVETLKITLSQQEEGSIDARMTSSLIDTMPGFARVLERERRLYNDGKNAGDKDVLDILLQVLTLPVVNMIGSIVMTLAPQNAHLRGVLTQHIFDNVFRGVHEQMIEGVEHGPGH